MAAVADTRRCVEQGRVPDLMLAASHRIAARARGRVVGFAGDDGVVTHAGVVGLMAVMLWSWSTKKGRLGRTALSAGYSFLPWGYPVDG